MQSTFRSHTTRYQPMMGTQWPQRFQSSHNHNYNGYQQPYHPQQQQQYGSQPNGAYPQAYQNTQSAPIQHHRPPQPDPNSCYNCGSPDHWAQDCPEPRREIPVGQINRQNFARPPKRQKPNPPIITKYPVPPHIQQAHGPPQGYGGPPYGQSNFPPHQATYGPPTPMSAQSPSQIQWQQPPYQQHYQQPYQHGNYYQPNGYQQHSYPTPTAQTPGPFYHQSSPQGPPHHPSIQQSHAQHRYPHAHHRQPYTGTSYSPMATPVNNYPPNKYNDNNYRAPENHHASQYSSRSAKSISETPKPHTPRSNEAETDGDNLSMLNIPDMPLSSARLTEQAVLAGTSLIRLVETPLPADFEVADATSPLELAKAENGGRCQSKYWGPGCLNDISQHIRETNEWSAISRDPIFLTFRDDSHVIPLEDLLSLYNPGRINEAIQGLEDQADGAVQEPNSPKNDSDTWDIMDSLEQSLSAGRLKKPDSTSSNDITLEDQSQPSRDTEKLLAALGVTGASKPIGATARPYPLPPSEQHQHSSFDDNSRSRSRSLSRHHSNGSYHRRSRSNSGLSNDYQNHHENNPHSDPCSSKIDPSQIVTPPGRDWSTPADKSYSQPFEPPPPPPLTRKPSTVDGMINSPVSAQPNHGNLFFSDHKIENGTTLSRYPMEGQFTPPTKLRTDKSNGRKREYDHRDSSEESETPGRRQADDVTPKLKRRQPKVAEAYSRRW